MAENKPKMQNSILENIMAVVYNQVAEEHGIRAKRWGHNKTDKPI